MKLKEISYKELNSRQKEIYNFQKVAGLLSDYGFNCLKLSDDWQGADFLAFDGVNTLKVQLKSRIAIYKKYKNNSLYIAFPMGNDWYLIEHDELLILVRKDTTWLKTISWQEREGYNSKNPNKKLIASIKKVGFKLGSRLGTPNQGVAL
jgi:hypothetical protein